MIREYGLTGQEHATLLDALEHVEEAAVLPESEAAVRNVRHELTRQYEHQDPLKSTESERLAEDDPDVDLSPAAALNLITNARRRRAISMAVEADRRNRSVDLHDVAEAAAARENDCEPHELDSQQRKRVYVGLYQTHMPKLVDAGVLVEEADNHFRATERAHALDDLASVAEGRCAGASRTVAADGGEDQ